jgi:hypothetical protein
MSPPLRVHGAEPRRRSPPGKFGGELVRHLPVRRREDGPAASGVTGRRTTRRGDRAARGAAEPQRRVYGSINAGGGPVSGWGGGEPPERSPPYAFMVRSQRRRGARAAGEGIRGNGSGFRANGDEAIGSHSLPIGSSFPARSLGLPWRFLAGSLGRGEQRDPQSDVAATPPGGRWAGRVCTFSRTPSATSTVVRVRVGEVRTLMRRANFPRVCNRTTPGVNGH